ncbi:uncharacterized protein METZ01_LOCUS428557, partial [marine metagenome]
MLPQESVIPLPLLNYMKGLKTHDIALIGSTFADDIQFFTPAKTMSKDEILNFLTALYNGFPDWKYEHDEPIRTEDGGYGVKWRQGGTHTGRLEFPGFEGVAATGRSVIIPEHFFYYKVVEIKLSEIRPDP